MSSILLADSGSTKTDWVWLYQGKKKKTIKTQGINPLLQGEAQIEAVLSDELKWKEKDELTQIIFYGAGVNSKLQEQKIGKILKNYFKCKQVAVHSDMLAAAHSLCGSEQGVVCILGTGSNSCFYDGKKIAGKMPSLGYIAGDEGSGNYMGKKVLRYYMYGTFDQEMSLAFEQRFGKDKNYLIQQLYQNAFPNRYLATFVSLLSDMRGYYMAENIIEDSFTEFFQNHILKYRQSWKMPVHFIGSIAYEFRDVLQNLCEQYEIELGKIQQSPLDGLVRYYKTQQ